MVSNTARIGPAGDDAGARGRRAQDDLAGAEAAGTGHDVAYGLRASGYADHVALRGIGGLADGFRHFAGLARTEADAALGIAHHDQRGESKPASALHHLGDAVDVDKLVDEFLVTITAIAASAFTFAAVTPTASAGAGSLAAAAATAGAFAAAV